MYTIALRVQLGETSRQDGSPLGDDELSAALYAGARVTTSRPSPIEFSQLYQQVLSSGSSAVVSVHVSSELSGTCESARMAARDFAGAVTVVDSRSVAMGLGFAALAAGAAANAGAAAEQVAAAAHQSVGRTAAFFYVDSLRWLGQGGRIGPAATRFATALSVKPLLQLSDGRVVAMERVRTTAKALARLIERAQNFAGPGEVEIAVQHLAAAARAEDVAQRLQREVAQPVEISVGEVGSVVGAHVGPGLIGVVVHRRS